MRIPVNYERIRQEGWKYQPTEGYSAEAMGRDYYLTKAAFISNLTEVTKKAIKTIGSSGAVKGSPQVEKKEQKQETPEERAEKLKRWGVETSYWQRLQM